MRPVANDTLTTFQSRPSRWTSAALSSAVLLSFIGCALVAPLSFAAENEAPTFSAADRNYWLWQPVKRPSIPADAQGGQHPVDAFLLAPPAAAKHAACPEADRRTLIRRATFDLHGLPPTPQEVEDFVQDSSPQAFERVVDRLLASPRYGEHWARHWLDLVRYAESDGFKSDDLRSNAWRYRDYVIRAFNDDKPYDRFISEQLAGDELAPDDLDARVATGFLRLGPYEENARDVLDQRSNVLNDITDVTGQVFLGLTFACARCHDHKYDPILQADYFRLQAFFAGLSQAANQPLATTAAQVDHAKRLLKWEEATSEARARLAELEAPYRAQLRAEKRSVFPDYVQVMLDTPSTQRSPLERQMAELAERQLVLAPEDILKKMKPADRDWAKELYDQLKNCGVERPEPPPEAMMARDEGPVAPETKIPNEDAAIAPGYLSILDPRPAAITDQNERSSGRRTALARWIASPDNPITARVMVNRVFQQHFGRGIVSSSEDFGRQGATPSDGRLLDFIASEFIAGGFRLKALHRLLMTSAAYRQAAPTPADTGATPESRQSPWWQTSNRRLTAEQLRDAMLAVSGELNLEMGGPSARGELPVGISAAYAWEPEKDVAKRNRRSIYMLSRRNLVDPLVSAFDLPDSHESCSRRQETTTAPQALMLLNSRWSLDRARALAARVLEKSAGDHGRAVEAAYSVTFQREATAEEVKAAEAFLNDQTIVIAERLNKPAEREKQTGKSKSPTIALPTGVNDDSPDKAWQAALVDFCHVLLNSNEFLYLD